MRSFLEAINEYPWTAFFVGVFILYCLDIIKDIFDRRK